MPLQDLGIRFRLGPPQVLGLLAAVLPLCLLSAAMQTYLATFARSFKEAQSYMGVLMMVPMLPGLLSCRLSHRRASRGCIRCRSSASICC